MTRSRLHSGLGLVCATALTCAVPLSADAAGGPVRDRLAVVVGNQDYDVIEDLGNARSDARRMAALLREMGFVVFDGYDVDRREFEELMRRSILNVDDGSEIVFFYAGHGIQIGRRNYLLPTDVAFESIYDLPVESMTLDRVIEVLSARGTVHVAIIDACRDNPFPDKMLAGNLDASLFETKSGFDVFRTPLNSVVAFSTAPGMVAFDGAAGENSPYTAAILSTVSASPQDEILSVFARVREKVYKATDGKQVPWESSTLVRPFRFADPDREVEEPLLMAQADTGAAGGDETRTTDTRPDPEPPVTFPEAVALELPYDRTVQIGPALAQELGLTRPVTLSVAAAPSGGTLVPAGAGGLVYRPTLAERRATTRTQTETDSFALLARAGDVEQTLRVTLNMEVDGCDMAAGDALDPGGVGFYRLPNEIEVAPALAACRAAVAANPDTPRFRYQLGRAEQAAGLFEPAFTSFEAAAEAGHIRAMNATARLLVTDKIDRDVVAIPEDRARADDLLDRAIAAGDPFAIHSRGLELLRHGPTQAAREEGFELLDRAAELGHTYSMNELGVYFLTRETDHYIPERGMRYLQASAARNDIYGFHNLGFVALYGLRDGNPAPEKAFGFFEKAALGGHPNSPATIGRMIIRGQLPGKTAQDAVKWYDMGLARGDGWGGVNAADLILSDRVTGFDRADALVRAAKALHLSNAKAVAAAEKLLAGQPARDMGRAVQKLLNALGENIAVDGAIGPRTRTALDALARKHGLPAPPDNRMAQLRMAAKLYWAERPTRPDLF